MRKELTFKLRDDSTAILIETDSLRLLRSENYNYLFNKKNGFFLRCGAKETEDGDLNLGLPEIADIEISTICSGVGAPCKFCYKGNTAKGEYMSLETFKKVFAKLPKTITQIAFGIGDIEANPDMFDIFRYCRENGVIPNVTINGYGMNDTLYDKLATLCGAVAISCYDKDVCYNAVEALTKRSMQQINIHFFLADETFSKAQELFSDIKNDDRLLNLNAVVFLSLKKKGRASKGYNRVTDDDFKILALRALREKINIGFDSCSAYKFLRAISGTESYEEVKNHIEPCESSVYSSYINVKGDYYPCSFMEGTDDWNEGLSVLEANDFLNDIWWNEKTNNFRNKVITCRNNCVGCPTYNI